MVHFKNISPDREQYLLTAVSLKTASFKYQSGRQAMFWLGTKYPENFPYYEIKKFFFSEKKQKKKKVSDVIPSKRISYENILNFTYLPQFVFQFKRFLTS